MVAGMDEPAPLLLLRSTDLRYALTRILQVRGPMTVAELVIELHRWGFTVAGRPSKTVSDTLRWEMRRDRVRRRGRGRYQQGAVPRSTDYRITARVYALREEVMSLRGEQRPMFPD
jgi:hypothetical protein